MYHMQVQYNAVRDKRRARTAHVLLTEVFKQTVRYVHTSIPTYGIGGFQGLQQSAPFSNPLLPLRYLGRLPLRARYRASVALLPR